MGAWVEVAELRDRYGARKVDDRATRDGSGVPDEAVVAAAIADAEGRVRSELLTRYAPADLPTTPGTTPPTLKRLALKFAWYYLWSSADIVPPAVIAERADAEAELKAVCKGGQSLVLSAAPAVDSTRPQVLRGSARTSGPDPITLAKLEAWGR